MAELATLSRPYANAVFGLLKSSEQSGSLVEGAKRLGCTPVVITVVQTMLSSPDLAAADKAAKLAELCADEINDEAGPFLQALAEHDRLMLLEEVRKSV